MFEGKKKNKKKKKSHPHSLKTSPHNRNAIKLSTDDNVC